MNNVAHLKQLKLDHDLTWKQIAERSGYSIHAINAWTSPKTAHRHRTLRDRELESIILKVKSCE